MRNPAINHKRIARRLVVSISLATLLLQPLSAPYAQQQKKESSPNVTGISSRKTSNGKVVTLSTDGPLKGTQTWQDPDGTFNMTLPGSGASQIKDLPPGVQVRKVGDSLQIAIPAKSGSNVTVQPRGNGIDLVVDGDTDPARSGAQTNASAQQSGQAGATASSNPRPQNAASGRTDAGQPASSASAPASSNPAAGNSAGASGGAPASSLPADSATSAGAGNSAPTKATVAAPPAQTKSVGSGGLLGYIFSYGGMGAILILALVIVLVVRRKQEGGWENVEEESAEQPKPLAQPIDLMSEETARTGERRKRNRRTDSEGGRRTTDQPASLVKASPTAGQNADQRETMMEVRQNALVPTALFGAYRVDQEVGKLILGQAHRMDVLASRAPDDRRALEASLLKALAAAEVDEDGRRRVREALEEYGFVARQSAAILLAPDAYERASAARVLGEVQSPSSLPFLLEALYDSEQIVRSQAVTSIGALKLPSAIGALLDMARRYPDMPQSILSRALSDCSVECLDFMDATPGRPFHIGEDGFFTGEIRSLEPSTTFEALPEWLEDESLAAALERLASTDIEARTAAAQSLALYQVKPAVDALTVLASQDTEASVRAAAVTSLGAIDHETVFVPVLMAFADEAREVRAAAARALSRLNFDRADAYVRLIETSDEETLVNVARASIHAGMVKQAFDRLASEDRRQMYESFTLLSLLARAGETAPILEAINNHNDINVRLAAVKLLGISGQPDVLQHLRELAVVDGVPEKLRMALMEVVYKIDQAGEQAGVQAEHIDC